MKISVSPLAEISVLRLHSMRSVIDMSPPYQREGGVWGEAIKQLLIDSIINGLDVPKLYFEIVEVVRRNESGGRYRYAVIDGKQRIGAIFDFLEGRIGLSENFVFFEDSSVEAAHMRYADLLERYPDLANRFLMFELPIMQVRTDSDDLIEEMFQRLNASKSLNSAELRNALSGPTRDAVNQLSQHSLLEVCCPLRNARYRYREFAAKFIAVERQFEIRGRITDTKAQTLLKLFKDTRGENPQVSQGEMESYREKASKVLDKMESVFHENDRLLSSVGTFIVYYIAFRDDGFCSTVTREMLEVFERCRSDAKEMSQDNDDYSRAGNARLREYNSLVQSTNDGSALTRRSVILTEFVSKFTPSDPLAGLEQVEEGDWYGSEEEE